MFAREGHFRSKELQDFLLQMPHLVQGHFDFLPFSEILGTQRQHVTPCKDCGLGDLDALEKSSVVTFLYGGFVLEPPLQTVALCNRTGKRSLDAIVHLLTREPDGFSELPS